MFNHNHGRGHHWWKFLSAFLSSNHFAPNFISKIMFLYHYCSLLISVVQSVSVVQVDFTEEPSRVSGELQCFFPCEISMSFMNSSLFQQKTRSCSVMNFFLFQFLPRGTSPHHLWDPHEEASAGEHLHSGLERLLQAGRCVPLCCCCLYLTVLFYIKSVWKAFLIHFLDPLYHEVA